MKPCVRFRCVTMNSLMFRSGQNMEYARTSKKYPWFRHNLSWRNGSKERQLEF